MQRKITQLEALKTTAMKLIEIEYGETIEDLIAQGSVRDVACRLGISYTSICTWRQRLGITVSSYGDYLDNSEENMMEEGIS